MRIGHVHLKVRSIDISERFYMKLLGAEQTERLSDHYSFLSMGDAHHELALKQLGDRAENPTENMIGLYHTAFEVRDTEELLQAVHRLEELEASYSLVDHGISWAVYAADPDGNGVEVYLDRRGADGCKKHWSGSSCKLTKDKIKAICY